MCCCSTSRPTISMSTPCARSRKRCSSSPAALSSSLTTAGFSTASPPTSSPSRATAKWSGSKATTPITRRIAGDASALKPTSRTGSGISRWYAPEYWIGRLPQSERAQRLANRPLRRSCGGASGLFAKHRDETLQLSPAMLDDRGELGALRDRHADPVYRDITDFIIPVAAGQAPVDFDRRRAGGAQDLAGNDSAITVRPAARHFELLAGVFGEPRGVGDGNVLLEQLDELRPLFLGRRIPITPEHETGDSRHVEIFAQQFEKPRHPLRLVGPLAEHRERLGAEIADQRGRIRGRRCRRMRGKDAGHQDKGARQKETSLHYLDTSERFDASEIIAGRAAVFTDVEGEPWSCR